MSFSAQNPPLPPQPPGGPDPFPLPGAPAPRPPFIKRPWVRYVAVGIVAFGLGAAAGGSGDGEKQGAAAADGPAPAVTVTQTRTQTVAPPGGAGSAPSAAVTVTVTAAPEAEPPAAGGTFDGDGTYLVGQDIQPGTYRSTGNEFCYWERAKNASGEFSAIIANESVTGTGTVTIAASDKVFKTQRCNTWTKIG